MIAVLVSWTLVDLIALVLLLRPWRQSATRPRTPWIAAILVFAWVLGDGAQTYRALTAQSMWTAASVALAYVPLKGIVLSLLAYGTVFSVRQALTAEVPTLRKQKWAVAGALIGLCAVVGVADVRATLQANRVRHARDPSLTLAEVNAIEARVAAGEASENERDALLSNPACPPAIVVQHFAGTPAERMAIARNRMLPGELAGRLARDPDPMVRVYAAYNPNLPAEDLDRLAADEVASVRDAAMALQKLRAK